MTATRPVDVHETEKTWAGQPRGLSTLYFTEMWERFSFYGMRALLILYLTAQVVNGGAGMSVERAASIFGWYMFGVYAMSIPGGWLADRFIGQYRSVLYGGIIIALGHFVLAFAGSNFRFFYAGLVLIVTGTGLLKPNVSTMVGSLYAPDDPRRDAGFSIFYMGINLGAFIAPLVCGTLGQRVGWHWGFGAAGIGMTVGVIQYALGRRHLEAALDRIRVRTGDGSGGKRKLPPLTTTEWKRIGAMMVFFLAAILFWGAFEQAGSSLNLFADRLTNRNVLGFNFPSTWFQSVNSLFIISLAPVFAWLWVWLAKRGKEPTSPVKFSLGLIFVGLGFLLLVPASLISGPEKLLVSPMWLVGVYFLHTIGELSLSPVGLSVVTKLAPERMVGSMMGGWFLATALGEKLGGWVAGFFGSFPLPKLFGAVFLTTAAAGLVMLLIAKPVHKLMGGVH